MRHILIYLAFLLPVSLSAQHFELGLMAGISNYGGDLGAESFFNSFGQTNAAFGGFVRYNINNYVAARFNVYSGTISGDDASANTQERVARNLSFKSSLLEFGLTGEFNILGYQPYGLERVFSPYLFAGVAFFHFDPKAFYDGRWEALQPLSTEGQGLPSYPERSAYSLNEISIPFGVGVKYAINDKWNLGLELGYRKTFTDYLDDVSTTYVDNDELLNERGALAVALSNRSNIAKSPGEGRGDPNDKDFYFIGGFTISYNFLDNGLVGSRGRNKKKAGCQTF